MYPYDKLLPIEQAIVAWKMANPILSDAIVIIIAALGIIGLVYTHKQAIAAENERIRIARAEKRAWIREHGGL